MIWLLYSDYLKESLGTATFIKFLEWYVWVIFLVLLIIDAGLLFVFMVYKINWLLWAMVLIGFLAGAYFGNEIRKIRKNRVGTHEDVYYRNIVVLRDILKKRSLNSKEQVELLVEQINEELPKLKTSELLIKPIYANFTIILMPIYYYFSIELVT